MRRPINNRSPKRKPPKHDWIGGWDLFWLGLTCGMLVLWIMDRIRL